MYKITLQYKLYPIRKEYYIEKSIRNLIVILDGDNAEALNLNIKNKIEELSKEIITVPIICGGRLKVQRGKFIILDIIKL